MSQTDVPMGTTSRDAPDFRPVVLHGTARTRVSLCIEPVELGRGPELRWVARLEARKGKSWRLQQHQTLPVTQAGYERARVFIQGWVEGATDPFLYDDAAKALQHASLDETLRSQALAKLSVDPNVAPTRDYAPLIGGGRHAGAFKFD